MPDPELLSPAPPPAEIPPAPQPPNTVFRGPNGIRAGWRALLFLLLVAAIAFGLMGAAWLLPRLLHRTPKSVSIGVDVSGLTPLGLGISEAVIFVVTALAALIMARIERRKWGLYGMPAREAFGKDFWIGTLVGFGAISTCLLGIAALHGFHLAGLAIHGATIPASIAAWSVSFIIVGLAEEFAFRGYLQYTLTTGMGFWPAAILLSALFGLAHAGNPGESKMGLASVVLFGLLFCFFLRRTGNLWLAVGFHMGWDWGQTFFYGVPDSGIIPYHNLFNSSFSGPAWLTGGTVGPEASVFTPIVLGLVAILFASVRHENRYQAP